MDCPKCGTDVSDSYQSAEPDVGIMGSGWYCDACDFVIDDDGFEPHDDDVQLFGMGYQLAKFNNLCHHCQTPLESGYGLAGGGLGPYMFCPAEHCGKTFIKSQDES